MSETPRTDAEAAKFGRFIIEWPELGKQKVTDIIPTDFARQLERELNALVEALEHHQRVFFGRKSDLTHMDRDEFSAAHAEAFTHASEALRKHDAARSRSQEGR